MLLSFFLGSQSLIAQPLTAIGDNAIICQQGNGVIDVQANDIAAGGGPYVGPSYLFSGTTSNGTVSLLNSDSILYTPNPGYFGPDNFSYYIGDSAAGNISIGIVVVQVMDRPAAVDDIETTNQNITIVSDVQENDTAKGGNLSTYLIGPALNGTATVLGLDSILFVPTPGYVGLGVVNYRVCNDCYCDTAVLYVIIDEPCSDPVSNDDLFDAETASRVFAPVLNNDLLQGKLPSQLVILSGPLSGSAIVTPSFNIRYESNPGFLGQDSILYSVSTECGSDTALLVIDVSDSVCNVPIANDDFFLTPWSDTCGGVFPTLYNDIDPQGGDPIVSIINGPGIGQATLLSNGLIAYVPSGNISDTGAVDTITYEVCNICGCDTAMMFISYESKSCNASSPVGVNDQYTLCAGDTVLLDLTENDFDLDGDDIIINSIVSQPALSNSTVTIANDTQVSVAVDPNFTGTDFFFYELIDGGNPANNAFALVYLEINNCINPPIIQAPAGVSVDSITVILNEDQDSVVCLTMFDQDDDPVSIVSITGGFPGTYSVVDDTCVSLVTAQDSFGTGLLTIIACDDRGPLCDTVYMTVIVLPENDPPVAVNDSIRYTWSGPMIINPLANDFDPEDDPIELAGLIGSPQLGTVVDNGNNTITYTADSNRAGHVWFEYIVCDSLGACDTGVIYILVPLNAVNDFAITDYETSTGFPVINNDAIGPRTIATRFNNASNGFAIVNPIGSATYTPFTSFQGLDFFSYIICDTLDLALGCDTAIVQVTVSPPPMQVVVPEGFSPNNDGINDVLVIENISFFPNATMIVYNRWGTEVWRSEGGYNNDFAGQTRGGDNLPDGTYFYSLELDDPEFPNVGGHLIINR